MDPARWPVGERREEATMNQQEHLRGRTAAAIERGEGDTERLATEWAMPFIPDDGGDSPTDVPFRGGRDTRRPVSGFVVFAGRLMMIFGLVVLLGGVYSGLSMRSQTVQRNLAPQVIAVSGAPTVRIENAVGTVRVVAGAADKVQVNASVNVRHISRGLADQALEGYTVDVTQEPSGAIVVNTRADNPFSGDDLLAGWLMHRTVNLTVTMPANGTLDLNVAAGRTTVEGITGRVRAEVNAGGLELIDTRLADGSSFKVNAGGLDFSGELLPDASIDVEVNAGGARLVLPRTTAARLEGSADAGSVTATGWSGTVSSSRGRSGSSNSAISGYLTDNTSTKSTIWVKVNAGGVEIIGRNALNEPQAPKAPEAPRPVTRP